MRLRRDGGDAVEAEAEFQFQKGAIKTGGGLPLPGGEPLFQFQKGAIKTKSCFKRGCNLFKFQFQKGAIKTDIVGDEGT